MTEAEGTYCKIPSDRLFDNFFRTFQQRQPTDQTMPMEVPPFIECSPDDQNPFAEEFTPEEVWTRLHRCSNTAPGPDGIRYAQWKERDKGGYAPNVVFNTVHRLGTIPQPWGKSVTILMYKKKRSPTFQTSALSHLATLLPNSTLQYIQTALDAGPPVTLESAPLKRDSCQLTAAASITSRHKPQ